MGCAPGTGRWDIVGEESESAAKDAEAVCKDVGLSKDQHDQIHGWIRCMEKKNWRDGCLVHMGLVLLTKGEWQHRGHHSVSSWTSLPRRDVDAWWYSSSQLFACDVR